MTVVWGGKRGWRIKFAVPGGQPAVYTRRAARTLWDALVDAGLIVEVFAAGQRVLTHNPMFGIGQIVRYDGDDRWLVETTNGQKIWRAADLRFP